jgi:hypothetical protein
MSKPFSMSTLAGLAAAIVGFTSAQSAPVSPVDNVRPLLMYASGGCGPYGWRGPYGRCHYNGYDRGGPAYWGNGCPPGSWRGPWGHCRNTPYHGRLPNGAWK